MIPYEFCDFAQVIRQAEYRLKYKSNLVHSARWQGMDITKAPEMATHEVTHLSFGVNLQSMLTDAEGKIRGNFLGVCQEDIKPNLPWADDHFEERVSGHPMNPGTQWEKWPYNKSASRFLEGGMFNHNYMERYWPKYAGRFAVPTLTAEEYVMLQDDCGPGEIKSGIRYQYGDLQDVISLLISDPLTRQAYLPIWFPEDTGGGSKRAPCTIGYHFLMREDTLSINYEIRSCDFVRHFRDDLYLTARLLLWVLERCKDADDRWSKVKPGKFFMQIGSLHVFRNDYLIMTQEK